LAEFIQAGGEILRSNIHKLINNIWNKKELPDQWKESIIVQGVHFAGLSYSYVQGASWNVLSADTMVVPSKMKVIHLVIT
jgi:hypothetical protein